MARRRRKDVEQQPKRTAVVTSMADIEEEIAEFLVPPTLVPRGHLTLIAGMPDMGKTLWLCETTAALTRGDYGDEPARCLITSTEDSIAHTLKPRLRAARAVERNVDFLSMKLDEEDAGTIRFPDDIDEYARIIDEGGYRFAWIDPLLGHINSKLISSFQDEELRQHLMTPLKQIAEEYDCAIVGSMHFNKRNEGAALIRVSGSLGGIVGPARSLIFLHQSPESETQRILTHEKMNLGPKSPSRIYEVEPVVLEIEGKRTKQARLRYVETCDYTGADLLSGKADTPEAVKAATEFLEAELADGPKPSAEIQKRARELDISKYAFIAAKKKLGIVSTKSGFTGGWELDLPFRFTTPKAKKQRSSG